MNWIDIKTQHPPFDVPVLVFGEKTTKIASLEAVHIQKDRTDFDFTIAGEKLWITVTHWMPLPNPPCDGNCGMSYCDTNGCTERKRFLTETPTLPMDKPGDG